MALNVTDFGSHYELVQFVNGKVARGLLTMPDPKDLTDEQGFTLDDGTNPPLECRIDFDGGGTGGDIDIDVSGIADGDKDALATEIETVINAVLGTLTITATAQGDKVALVTDAVGAVGNVAIVQTAAAVEFGIEGMAGGSDVIAFANIVAIREHHGRWYLFWDA